MNFTSFFKKFVLRGLLFLGLYLAGIMLHGWLNDWQPSGISEILASPKSEKTEISDSILTFVCWNVGYGGLGAEADLFLDDEGKWLATRSMVRPPQTLIEKFVGGAVDFLKNENADFFLLQEVDVESKRSYDIHQLEKYGEVLPKFSMNYAANFRCPRVPIPVFQPWKSYGKVESGIATFSKFQPKISERHQLPGKYPMPDRLFQLDRCLLVQRFSTKFGADLVVVNLHNAAHDPTDVIKKEQLKYFTAFCISEFEKGNFVVAGGDWNQCPPYFRFDSFIKNIVSGQKNSNLPDDLFPEDWKYGYDPTVPTNRKAADPYQKGVTFETLVDYFLVSPNVKIRKVSGVNQGFAFSDHQPVRIEIEIL